MNKLGLRLWWFFSGHTPQYAVLIDSNGDVLVDELGRALTVRIL